MPGMLIHRFALNILPPRLFASKVVETRGESIEERLLSYSVKRKHTFSCRQRRFRHCRLLMKQRKACRLNYECLVSSFHLNPRALLVLYTRHAVRMGARIKDRRIVFSAILVTTHYFLFLGYFKTRLVPNDATYRGRDIDSGVIVNLPRPRVFAVLYDFFSILFFFSLKPTPIH